MGPIRDHNTVARELIHGLTPSERLHVGIGVAHTIRHPAKLLYRVATRISLSRLFSVPPEIGD